MKNQKESVERSHFEDFINDAFTEKALLDLNKQMLMLVHKTIDKHFFPLKHTFRTKRFL